VGAVVVDWSEVFPWKLIRVSSTALKGGGGDGDDETAKNGSCGRRKMEEAGVDVVGDGCNP